MRLHPAYTRAWTAWLLAGAVIEAAALAHGEHAGTLTRHVRVCASFEHRGRYCRARRVAVALTWGWLAVHITTARI